MPKQTNKEKNTTVFVELDRTRKVRFGHKALKELSALTGKNLSDLSTDELDLSEVEKIMYCGLLSDAKENNETLKLEDMEDLLDMAPNYMTIIEAMNQALDMAFQPTEKQKN